MSFVDYAVVDEINYRINHMLRQKPDSVEHWQKADETRKLGTGDCEDHAILKAQELKDAGIDISIVTIAVCHTRKSDGLHAICLVPSRRRVGIFKRRWSDCTLVMDNLTDQVYRIENTGYSIVKQYPAKDFMI